MLCCWNVYTYDVLDTRQGFGEVTVNQAYPVLPAVEPIVKGQGRNRR